MMEKDQSHSEISDFERGFAKGLDAAKKSNPSDGKKYALDSWIESAYTQGWQRGFMDARLHPKMDICDMEFDIAGDFVPNPKK